MSQNLWTAVDHYIVESLVRSDPVLEATLAANADAGLPAFDVSANQGKFLHLLARIQGARRVLEIGTLGGYSTIWLGRALPPDGLLVTLESDPKHIAVARANVKRAGLLCTVEFREGPALESLARLRQEDVAPFDFVFIDADKPNNPAYLEWSLRLARPGTVIVGDNVVREGAVINSRDPDGRVQGVRRFFEMMAGEPRLAATALQTVGSKGYDGFSIALVTNR
jgi:predicted O-methyltransferase YrrM